MCCCARCGARASAGTLKKALSCNRRAAPALLACSHDRGAAAIVGLSLRGVRIFLLCGVQLQWSTNKVQHTVQ